ncbi:hypothetical protein M422DRAFT_70352 [Sphaerobolus stellatus SS14]|uniref:Granulins domain-containing protein n=1 Tax=Sphaerobolus stellatus (strain SS14) TaxID=990650 RepID=A0A0C9UFV3_SPHS4|nr:hypothetical protein M422DRAFT_70352 [Sphaerobolus stellatus SS14]
MVSFQWIATFALASFVAQVQGVAVEGAAALIPATYHLAPSFEGRSIDNLLKPRACPAGFGLCSIGNFCCPTGDFCCVGSAGVGCNPPNTNCCFDGRFCDAQHYCVEINSSTAGCCPNGKICTV